MIGLLKKAYTRKIKRPFLTIENQRIKRGDKVAMSDETLRLNGLEENRAKDNVYLVEDIEVSIWQGRRFKLHCGTTLWEKEAVLVANNTPLRT